MPRYVKQENINNYLNELLDGRFDDFQSAMIMGIRDNIATMPTEDVTPVIHAKWEYTGYSGNYKCSNCGNVEAREHIKYCNVCGARLDG